MHFFKVAGARAWTSRTLVGLMGVSLVGVALTIPTAEASEKETSNEHSVSVEEKAKSEARDSESAGVSERKESEGAASESTHTDKSEKSESVDRRNGTSTIKPRSVRANRDYMRPGPVASFTKFSCKPNDTYSLSVNGNAIGYYDDQKGWMTDLSSGFAFSKYAFNGLGIAPGGETAYMFDRYHYNYSQSSFKGLEIWRFHKGTWTSVAELFPMDAQENQEFFGEYFLGGAVDPTTGDYYFTSYNPVDRGRNVRDPFAGPYAITSMEAWIYKYSHQSGVTTAVGYVPFAPRFNGNEEVSNGDIAFDSNGNLMLVRGAGDIFEIATVPRSELERGASKPGKPWLWASVRQPVAANFHDINGISFNYDGTVWLSDKFGVQRFNPITGRPFPAYSYKIPASTAVSGAQGDLASCATPSTIVLKKDVVQRVDSSDQFQLELRSQNAFGSFVKDGDVTTNGSKTGVQPMQVGAFPATPGTVFTFNESMASGSRSSMEAYNSSIACSFKRGGEIKTLPVTPGVGRFGTITFPEVRPEESVDVECVITNKPKTLDPAVVTLKKEELALGSSESSPAAGWNLSTVLESAGISSKQDVQQVSGADGSASWQVDFKPGVKTGQVKVSEDAASKPGFKLKSATCKTTRKGVVTQNPVGENQTSADLEIRPGDKVECTFVNEELSGSVTWSKADQDTKRDLAGSVWTISPDGGEPLEVTDCVADPGPNTCEGSLDDDSRPGHFKVSGLKLGEYTLTELKAPAGYALDSQDRYFTLTADALDYEFKDPILNQKANVPTLPLTGGTGSHVYLFGGLGILTLGAAMLLNNLRRKRAE